MSIQRRARLAAIVGLLLAVCAGGGFVVGRQLRPSAYEPQPVRAATARLSFVSSLSALPGLPALASRP